ncbi:hypothetical protein GS415_03960 [Rhodococcus hoagii]|nr:hypothetical protein [Prescottella equi]
MSGRARISGNARIAGGSFVYGDAIVKGDAHIDAVARVWSNAVIRKDAHVIGGCVEYDADLTKPEHHLFIPNFGSEQVNVNLFRTQDGYSLDVGCWDGEVGDLMDEVRDRREYELAWTDAKKRDRKRWFAEYKGLTALLEARVKSFHK